jgi:hypothetical protein
VSADKNAELIKRANAAGVPHEWMECVSCDTEFVRVKRGRNPYVLHCHTCRESRDRVSARERMARVRAKIKPSPGPEPLTLLDYCAHQDVDTQSASLTEDRLPRGYLSPAGPDHGHTSEFEDLRNTLDLLSQGAAECDWWANNRHWHDGLGEEFD